MIKMFQSVSREVMMLCGLLIVSDYHHTACSSLNYGSGSDWIESGVHEAKGTKVRAKRFLIDNGVESLSDNAYEYSYLDGYAYDDDEIDSAEELSEVAFNFSKNLKPMETTTVSDATNPPLLLTSPTPREEVVSETTRGSSTLDPHAYGYDYGENYGGKDIVSKNTYGQPPMDAYEYNNDYGEDYDQMYSAEESSEESFDFLKNLKPIETTSSSTISTTTSSTSTTSTSTISATSTTSTPTTPTSTTSTSTTSDLTTRPFSLSTLTPRFTTESSAKGESFAFYDIYCMPL